MFERAIFPIVFVTGVDGENALFIHSEPTSDSCTDNSPNTLRRRAPAREGCVATMSRPYVNEYFDHGPRTYLDLVDSLVSLTASEMSDIPGTVQETPATPSLPGLAEEEPCPNKPAFYRRCFNSRAVGICSDPRDQADIPELIEEDVGFRDKIRRAVSSCKKFGTRTKLRFQATAAAVSRIVSVCRRSEDSRRFRDIRRFRDC